MDKDKKLTDVSDSVRLNESLDKEVDCPQCGGQPIEGKCSYCGGVGRVSKRKADRYVPKG
jgi:hypothetical protein